MALLASLRPFSKPRHLPARRGGGLPAGDPDESGPPGGVAFVFQGGGSLAAPQVGMLRALVAAGLTPDLVIGSSAGALNAVAFASNPTAAGLDSLEAVWRSLRRRDVAPLSARTLLAAIGRGDGLVSSSAFRVLLASAPIASTLEGTLIPAHVVVTELASGAAVVLSDGETVPALLASCAFPGLFPPVQLGPRLVMDGGVSADVPVRQAAALGARTSYVLPAAAYGTGQPLPRGPMRLAFRALGQVLDSVARSDVAAAGGPVYVLPAPVSEASHPVDFRDTSRLIDEGYRLAADWLAAPAVPAGAAAAVSSPSLPVAR
jgi:NTE family protein